MNICVISDLHCKYLQKIDDPSDTLLISNKPRKPANQHPVAALLSLIKSESITTDVLLCPGDLGDKADEQGIASSWTFLQEIKQTLNAKTLIGIPGNHDVNSRNILGKEPFSYIKTFHENFPVDDEALKTKFWESGYCIVKDDNFLFLLINTIHNHTTSDKAKESSILPETLEAIEKELRQLNGVSTPFRVCMMHHHPVKHSNIQNWKDTDSIERGDDLIALLSRHEFTIVIHGHKHQPRIIEFNSLPVFAAGSFGSLANLNGTGINTMFHIIELHELKGRGFIHSYEYDIVNGWSKKLNKAFPPKIGFGGTIEVSSAAKMIYEMFQAGGKKPIFYESVIEKIEDVQYLIPDKLVQLGNILQNSYGIKASPDYPLEPIKISEYLKK